MKITVKELREKFRALLGELSVEEIASNRELRLRAELIGFLLLNFDSRMERI